MELDESHWTHLSLFQMMQQTEEEGVYYEENQIELNYV